MVTVSALTRRTWWPPARWAVADGRHLELARIAIRDGSPTCRSPSATGRPAAGRHLRRVTHLPVAICDPE